MKNLIVAFFAITLPVHAFSQERSVLQGVIEEMTKKYLEEVSKTFVTKKLEEYAAQKLGMELTGRLGTALAFVSLVDGIIQYDKATSETQRYQSFSQTVASGISLVAPPVGALVGLGVMAQGMMGALVSKTYSLKIAKLVNEISDLERKSSELLIKQAESEKNRFAVLLARSEAIKILVEENSKIIERRCSVEQSLVAEINSCFQSALLQRSLLRLYISTMARIAGFNGRFINVIAGLNQTEIAKINATLKAATDHVTKIELSIQETVLYLTTASALFVRDEVKKKYRHLTCERLLLSNTKKILSLKILIENSAPSAELLSFAIEEYQIDLKSLAEESCAEALKLFDPSIQAVIQSLLHT
ncbi:hypothetical protein AZI86_02075 [Bdellovibrio bacteriovorus]|uniref:Uncharacterized protein n=1 Tax=Bdellovibrio bacteriovorus TaxID=959 RepID=A0A150WN16_BDEBC|nr:hypothetical protein [Bdellovibrio bacteriovorus]KYG65883.1 hypothetical protein AZI86_02075 [Bdellovibrio bacteriovorus]